MFSGTSSQRIALMLPRLSRYGGAERFAWRLAHHLGQTGFDVDFICARQESEAPQDVTPRVVGRKGLCRSGKILWYAMAAERQRRAGHYDLTLSMGKTWNQDVLRLSGGPLPVFWRLSKQAYDPGVARTWKMLRRKTAPANRLINCLERRQMRTTPHFVAVSDKLVDWVQEAYPTFDASRIQVIYNQPDLTAFKPYSCDGRRAERQQRGLAPDRIYIGTAGTNFALKGVGCLIAALAQLPDSHHLLVAGDRNPDRYRKQAQRLGVAHRVTFLGRVEDMTGFYNCLDAFALPTFYDACSNAVLEALRCGVPTLSSSANGSSVFLDPENTIKDPRDTQVLARTLRRLCAEPRRNAFAWPNHIRAGLEAYTDLIETALCR